MMKLAYFQFPTTTLLVDDDSLLLNALSYSLNKRINTHGFTDPERALNYLLTKDHSYFSQRYQPNNQEDIDHLSYDHITVKIDPLNLHHIIYSEERFDYPSVAVIDYTMPKLNGEQLVRKLQHLPIKKIMLTGNADFDTAIMLFNEGLIDQYIVKDVNNIAQQLETSIQKLQHDFFVDFSQEYLKPLDSLNTLQSFKRAETVQLIQKLRQRHNFVEHYLVDIDRRLLFINNTGSAYWFNIITDTDIQTYQDIAEGNEADTEIVAALRNKKQFPILSEDDLINLSISGWKSRMHEIHPVPGTTDLYYNLIPDSQLNLLDKTQYHSYKDWCNKQVIATV